MAGQQQLCSFDTDGILTTPVGVSGDIGYSVAVQPDGKILFGGCAHNGSDYDFALIRYNPDGSLDTSFGNAGKVITPIGPSEDWGESVAIQADGKILLGGFSHNGTNRDFALVRYNADGSLDSGFGTDGKVITPIGGSDDWGYGVAIQADGKILLGGRSYNGSNYDFALVRYNTDGSLDTSFSGDGMVTTGFGSSSADAAYSVALQADGKILLAGDSNVAGTYDFALVRYNSDGSLDTSFSGDGKLTTPVGTSSDYSGTVAVQPDGKILQGGASSGDFALVRYNANGTLDATFDGDGKLTTAIGAFSDWGENLTVQPDGKIVFGGRASNGVDEDFALVRYNTDGSLDTSFSGDGKLTTGFSGSSSDGGYAVGIQADGKILLAGTSSGTFAMVRYDADGVLDDGTRFSIPTALAQNVENNFAVTATDASGSESLAADVPTITEDSPPSAISLFPNRVDENQPAGTLVG